MYKIKIFLLSIIGITVFFAAILAYILSTYNNQDYQELLIKAVDNFSDYTLTIKGPFALNRSLTPILSASEIELHAKTDASFIHIEKFRIQLTLAPLLDNTLLINDLLLEDVQIEIQTREESKNAVNLSRYLPVPIIEHAVLKNVQLTLNNDKPAYHLDSLIIAENESQNQMEIQATGKIEPGKFNFKGIVSLLDDENNLISITPDAIAELISGEQIKLRYKGKSTIGKARTSSDLMLSFIKSKPQISGELSMSNLFLQDIDLFPKQGIDSKEVKRQAASSVYKPLFSHTAISLQLLQTIDLNLKFKINKLKVKHYQFDKINIAVSLKHGKLTVDPVSFDFTGEQVLMAAEIDARAKPEWAFSISAKDIQVTKIMGQQNTARPRTGKFGIDLKLKATGTSLHEIVSNLNGDVSFMLENEKINRSELEVVFLNPMGWVFSKGIVANEIYISCGLARYEINEGVIKSKVLLIDGPTLIVRGKEEINLGEETINSFYNLHKKNILDNTILLESFETDVPIKVTGNLANPTVEQAPLKSLEAKAERYILAPAALIPHELLGTALDILGDNKKVQQNPCAKYLQN